MKHGGDDRTLRRNCAMSQAANLPRLRGARNSTAACNPPMPMSVAYLQTLQMIAAIRFV